MNPQTLTLTFTVEELNAILTALGHRPYLEVVGVIQKIQTEAQRQMTPPAPVSEDEDQPQRARQH